MKTDKIKSSSRKKTPWTDIIRPNPLEELIDNKAQELYENRHPEIEDSGEIVVLNSYKPSQCPYCNSKIFIKDGKKSNGLQKYRCKNYLCKRNFLITTNTIFDNHKIPITEWIDTCLSLFSGQSFNSIAKNGRNSYSTTKYWFEKILLVIDGYADSIVLKDNVFIDETFFSVVNKDIEKARGRSSVNNKYCIGIGCDSNNQVFCSIECRGGTTNQRTYKTFKDHIIAGSNLTHDACIFHTLLVDKLKLRSTVYKASMLKDLDDKKDPLNPINRRCFELKTFLHSHPGLDRSELKGYLDLYCFIYNPPINPYDKVYLLLEKALTTPSLLRYKSQFNKKIIK